MVHTQDAVLPAKYRKLVQKQKKEKGQRAEEKAAQEEAVKLQQIKPENAGKRKKKRNFNMMESETQSSDCDCCQVWSKESETVFKVTPQRQFLLLQ